MGKNKTPNHLKVLQGSPKRNHHKTVNILPTISMWPAPKVLGKHGAKLWKETGPILLRSNIMTDLDKGAFEGMCTIWNLIMTCTECLQKEDLVTEDARGSVKKSPYCTILNQYLSIFRSYSMDFGMTPLSRSTLGIPATAEDFLDPVERFRKQREDKEFEDLLD